jgi:hypothetical protein
MSRAVSRLEAKSKTNPMEIAMKFFTAFTFLAATAALWSGPAAAVDNKIFRMVASSPSCAAGATGRVTVSPQGGVENMHVEVTGLPADTEFDLFIIQVPRAPFGLSWYQGDISTDSKGVGVGDFAGRFSIETFTVAPGAAPAPKIHAADAATNPATPPVHMFHLGLWFASPADALAAGCPGTVTPFNGDHTAGVQVLNTGQFADKNGPLRAVK